MKRILALVLALLMAMVPVMSLAAPSPTLVGKIYCTPGIAYHLVEDESLEELVARLETIDLTTLCGERIVDSKYSVDEVLYIELTKTYESIEWHIMPQYDAEKQEVAMVLFGIEDDTQLFIWGTVNEDGSVTFDYSEVGPGLYYMYIISGDKIMGDL